MTQNKRPGSLSQYQRESAIRRKQAPAGPNPNARLYTGIFLLAIVLASIFFLWKPLAPKTEYLRVTASNATIDTVRGALVETGALANPNSVVITEDGGGFRVGSADPENPLTNTTWQALASNLPAKLTGATAELRADAPPLINLGLDLQGGLRVVMGADPDDVVNPTPEQMERVRTIIENRVNGLGVAEPTVQVQGRRQVVLEYPGLSQAQQATILRLVGQAAKLEFRIVKDESANKTDDQMTVADLLPAGATGEDITDAQAAFDQFGRPQVNMTFNAAGAQKMGNLTGNNINKRMAIVLDDRVITAPTIQGRINDQGQITSIGTVEEATQIALVLRSGSLPFGLVREEVRGVGPTLGQDAIRAGILASVVGVALVFLLLFGYYGLWFGSVAALGLLFSGLVIAGIFSGLGVTLTLPGIAGLVLTIGAAVDGNVISFERIKEEMRGGNGIRKSVRSGFDHSFSAIFDSNFANLLAAFALYSYSTGPVRGFAVTLAVGVIVTVFSNVVVSRFLLESLARVREFSARTWFATPHFDFIRASRYITFASLALAVLGGVIIGVKGFNWGVDFTSGTALTLRTEAGVRAEDVRSALGKANVEGASASNSTIVETVTPGITGKDFTVRVEELSAEETEALTAALETLPGGNVTATEIVSPVVGQSLRGATVLAVGISLGLILLFIALRFDLTFGISLVIATAHDIFIVLGLVSLLGREFSLITVSAILTLIGFSLNDSVIISDRVRENLKLMRGKPFPVIVNASINQTLSRTVLTSLTALLPLLALLVFGGPVLRDFAIVVVVGFIVGTYSSIAIVSPMIVHFKEWQARRKAARREVVQSA
ncbi:MAG TPA: protein translocase subunit SecD [Deinococcales bacterium]|nr:protein translocase subunit SecD [Deinococcales bacterium]